MERRISFETHRHIGDNVICTGVIHNVKMAHPEIRFRKPDYHYTLWDQNPDVEENIEDCENLGRIGYGAFKDERVGRNGDMITAFTKNLCEKMRIPPVPILWNGSYFVLSEEEKARSVAWNGRWLLNAGCQTCSVSKCYPHWQKVVDLLRGLDIWQIGGNEHRDLTLDLKGVTDYRGKSTIRDMVVMAYGCRGVISPPSSMMNIASAFHKPQVIVNGSREPDSASNFENVHHVSHKCSACGWGKDNGCIKFHVGGESQRSCSHVVHLMGRDWCQCMAEIPPEDIADAVRMMDRRHII